MIINRHSLYLAGVLTLLAIGLLLPGAFGDVTVVRSLKIKDSTASGVIEAHSAMQLRGHASRRETDVTSNGTLANRFHYPVQTITLVALDKGEVHVLNSSKSDFEKIPLSRWTKYLSRLTPAAAPSGFRIAQSWSRVVPENETKIIRGLKCSKFTYEWRFEIENPETYAKKQYGVRTTLWLTELTAAMIQILQEEKAFQSDYHKRMGGMALEDLNAVSMQYASDLIGLNKETLFSALSQGTVHLQRIRGYPMSTQTDWFLVGYKSNKPLFTITSELEALSLKPLPDTVFAPSKKYVPSYDEFDTTGKLLAKNE